MPEAKTGIWECSIQALISLSIDPAGKLGFIELKAAVGFKAGSK